MEGCIVWFSLFRLVDIALVVGKVFENMKGFNVKISTWEKRERSNWEGRKNRLESFKYRGERKWELENQRIPDRKKTRDDKRVRKGWREIIL